MKDLIIFPYGGNAKEAVTVIEAINKTAKIWNIVGFLDDNTNLHGEEFSGYKVLGGKDLLSNYPDAQVLAVPGSPNNYFKREYVINLLNIKPERFATIIHPCAEIGKEVSIGYNTLIMAGVVLTANVKIGNHCVILPNSVISHDSIIEDYCMIGSNVSVSGNVTVKKQSYIGTGSRIIQEITIEEATLVGIGSVVLKSTNPQDVIVGNPGRFLKRIVTP